jgi:hypothetical protein
MGQRFWERWASKNADLQFEMGTPEDSTANNRLACNHDGGDGLGFQSGGRWGIQ